MKPCLEDIQKTLELLEPNVPTAHPEAASWVPWMFLAVLRQASLEVQDQAQQVQQLQCQEEVLEKWLVASERMLQGPDGLLPSSRSGSAPTVPQQVRLVIRQQMEVKQPLAPAGQADGSPPG